MWIRCNSCKRHKPLWAFSKRKNSTYSIRKQCITCRNKLGVNNYDSTKAMIKNKRFKELNPNYREEYYKTHKKQELGKNAKWYINNKLHHQALVAKYRILKREQSINLTQQELVDIQSYYILSSYLSSFGTPYEVDHIMPIAKGGATHSSNLQVITQRDNRSKGARLEYTYKDEVFKL